MFLSPSISVRLEGSFQGEHVTTSESTTGGLVLSSSQATSVTDVIVGAGWHQGGERRTTITYVAGMVFRRRQDEATVAQTVNFPGLPPLIGLDGRPVITVNEQTLSRTSYGAGVMAGVDVTIAISTHFAIVPEVRMIAADGDWNIRPGVALRWKP